MKKSNDTNGNRIRDLPACSAVPQPTELLRVPLTGEELDKISTVPLHLICDLGFVWGKKKVN